MTQSLARHENKTRATSKTPEENTRPSRATKGVPRGPRGNYASWINDKDSEGKSSLDIIVDWLKEEDNYFRCMTELSARQEHGVASFKCNDIIELLVSTGHKRREVPGVQHQIKYLHTKYRTVINEFQEMATFDFDQDSQIVSYNRNGRPYKLGDLIKKRFKYFYILRPVFLKWESAFPESTLPESQNNESSSTKYSGNKRPRENNDNQNLSKKLPRVVAESEEEKDSDDDDDDDDEEESDEEEEYKEDNGGFWNWTWLNQPKASGANALSKPPNTIKQEEKKVNVHQSRESENVENYSDSASEEEEDNRKEEDEENEENKSREQKTDSTTVTKDSNSKENENKLEIQTQTRSEEQHTNQPSTINTDNEKPYLPSSTIPLKMDNRGNHDNNDTKDNHGNNHKISSDNTSNNNHTNNNARKRKPKKKTKKKNKFSVTNVIKQKMKMNTRKLALNERKVALAERIVTLEEKRFELMKKSLDLKEKGILLSEEVNEQKKETKSLFSGLFKWLF